MRLGLSLSLGALARLGTSIPTNAVRDRSSNLVKDRSGSNILTRLAFLASVSTLTAVGSMTAGSDALALDSNPGFVEGDYVIVETGGEAGEGLRGSRGVGGAWPALSYTDVTAMNADTSQAENKMAWVEATGDTYYWNGSAWVQPTSTDYYNLKAVPKALVARVTAVNGTTLTLDKQAAEATTSANVYFDNWGIIQTLITTGAEVTIPAGTYHVSDHFYINGKTNFTLSGAGKTTTILKTPQGASHGGAFIINSPNCTIEDLTFDCSFREEQYQFRWEDGRAYALGSTNAFLETFRTSGWAYGQGIHFRISDNGVARNIRVVNPAQQSVTTSSSYDCWAYNCTAQITEPPRAYIQWMFQWTDIFEENRGGGCQDCDVDSNHLHSGFEAFKARDVTFLRCSTRNAVNANNGADGTLFDELSVVIEAGAAEQSFVSSFTPVLSFNSNVSGYSTKQNTVRNPTIVQEGYVRSETDRLQNITSSNNTAPLLVEGTYDTDPTTPKGLIDVQVPPVSGTNAVFGAAILAGGGTVGGVTVNGIRATGTMLNASPGPMHTDGLPITVTDSIFTPATVTGPAGSITESGNQTNAEYEA